MKRIYIGAHECVKSGTRRIKSIIYKGKYKKVDWSCPTGVTRADKAYLMFLCRVGDKEFTVYLDDCSGEKRYFILE